MAADVVAATVGEGVVVVDVEWVVVVLVVVVVVDVVADVVLILEDTCSFVVVGLIVVGLGSGLLDTLVLKAATFWGIIGILEVVTVN